MFNGRLTRVSADDCSRIVSQLTGSSDSSYSMSIARYTFSISFSFCTGEFVSWNEERYRVFARNIKGIFTKFAFIIRRWNKAQSVIKLCVSHARFSWTLTFSSPFSFNHTTLSMCSFLSPLSSRSNHL